MESDLLDLARTVDLTVLGARIKQARQAKRLTQTEVAGAEMSTAYVSRIESGQRRPDPELLAVIATRVGIGLDQLVLGTTRDRIAEARLGLVSAEMELKTGNAPQALSQVDETLMDLAGQSQPDLQHEALRIKAAALEAAGRLDEAIILLEDLTDRAERDTTWLRDLTALCRCYRVSGEIERSIQTGEQGVGVLKDYDLAGTGESTTLMLSLSASYFEHGEVGLATRMCQRAVVEAETTDSPASKGIAYWSASIMESRRGDASAALALARKALVFIEIGEDYGRKAALRSQLGILQLRGSEPDPAGALDNLRLANIEMAATDTPPSAIAGNRVAQARALLMLGDVAEATSMAHEVATITTEPVPLVAADAWVLLGQISMTEGDHAAARHAYREAVTCLICVGADRKGAQLWFELASSLEQLGETADALDAFRRAGAATGLTPINAFANSLPASAAATALRSTSLHSS